MNEDESDWRPCVPPPCPPLTETSLVVTAYCSCGEGIPEGLRYAPGCLVHDPAEFIPRLIDG